MLFNSYQFLLFFAVVAMLYFMLPHRGRSLLLLAASYFFYMSWQPFYAILLAGSTVADYFIGLFMGRTGNRRKRLLWLTASLFVNLGLIYIYKYYGFTRTSVSIMGSLLGREWSIPELRVLLPVGISFFTFQKLSYTIELYRGRIDVERSLVQFALYVAFFPQLVAGPIERADELLPQLKEEKHFDPVRVIDGLKLMAWGMFKKVVIADRLALLVNEVFNNVPDHTGFHFAIAAVLFSYQIYCDFSGYSDIAIGAAQVLGIRLMTNFDRPYFSQSIPEFWRRWHISLSTWFRDYLYIPLGGSRVGLPRWYINLLVVFVVSGLWHGANFTFIAWGLLHGIYMVAGHMTGRLRRYAADVSGLARMPGLLSFVSWCTVWVLVAFAWIFFRANCITDALNIVKKLPSGWGAIFHDGPAASLRSIGSLYELCLGLGLIIFMEAVSFAERGNEGRSLMRGRPVFVRWLFYAGILFAIANMGVSEPVPFIYFQF